MKSDSNVITGGYLVNCIIVDPQFIVNKSYVTFDQVSSHFAGLFLSSVGGSEDNIDEMVGFGGLGGGGAAGPPGSPGATGPVGASVYLGNEPGEDGDIGIPGAVGLPGQQGLQGVPGSDGLDGDEGQTIVGPQGLQGVQGLSGVPGVQEVDVIELINQLFGRVKFLELALGVNYSDKEIYTTDQNNLLDDRFVSDNF